MNSDTKGTSSIKFLAVGFQVCVNIGRVTLGVEFLWSLSDGKLYIFTFFGGSKDLGGKTLKLKDLVNKFKNIAYSKNAIAKLTKTKFSGGIFVSIIAVMGNKNAKFPHDYCGWFSALSFSFKLWFFKGIVSGAVSIGSDVTIGSLGVGVGMSTDMAINLSFSQTYYWQWTGGQKNDNNNDAKSAFYSKTKWLTLVYSWFF